MRFDVIWQQLKRSSLFVIGRFDSMLLACFFALYRANRIVQKKLDECSVAQYSNDSRLKLPIGDLQLAVTDSVQRVERIENKAMGTLLGVAVAVAVFGTATSLWDESGPLSGEGGVLQASIASLLLAALVYLFGSGLLALGAYKIGPIYRPTLESCAAASSEEEVKALLIYSIDQNNRVGIMRSNRLSASFSFLRNGLVAVFVLGGLLLFLMNSKGL